MLSYRRYGSGPTLVMQHGFLGGNAYWLPQVGVLSSIFDVITPDLAGFAASRDAPVETSIEGHARAVVDLLDRLDIERCHLLGHSMGGMVALQVALDWPERISRLILYGTASSGRVRDRFEPLEASIRRIHEESLRACAERIVATWLVDGEASMHYPLCLRAGHGTREDAAVAALAAIGQWDVTQRLGELAVPTLVICGDRDRSISPQQAYSLWKGIRGGELCIAPGCAHGVHLDAPGFFNEVVRAFLLKTA